MAITIAVLAVQKQKCEAKHAESSPLINNDPWKLNDNTKYRLSDNVKPTNYKIRLNPDTVKKVLHGQVNISFTVAEHTDEIVLHGSKLGIQSVVLTTLSNNNEVLYRKPVKRISIEEKTEFIRAKLDRNLHKDIRYTLEITYNSSLNRGLAGPYTATIKNTNRSMVASKFQPTYARRAFPCFDEPEYKATYDITLVKPMSDIALSNMNEISRTVEGDDKEAVTYATSVPMSTYLACFVVCDSDYKEVKINTKGQGKNFMLRAYAQKDHMKKIDFALDIGKRATEFYIGYYNVPYPLPKLDMIGIPDYQSGATEHWGLITYRETSFLFDQATSSAFNKVNIASTIAHELAHMWFGNLVTLKWWDDIWLNEGFASYMQYKVLNAIEPTWGMYDQFVTKTFQRVLDFDSKLSSHPIVQTAESPDQITALFDVISYNKGASVLRMIEGFIGEENFRKGISDYLKKYQFSNAVTQDLLNELEKYFNASHSGLNLTYIVDTWTRQTGYPLLTVTEVTPLQYTVSQSRYLQDPDAKYNREESPFQYKWYVPLTYNTNLNKSKSVQWLSDKDPNVEINLREGEKWLKLNLNSVGYYRVLYPVKIWESLIGLLKNDVNYLSASDKTNLLDDVFALANSEHVQYALALELAAYLSKERQYAPWYTAHEIFSVFLRRFQSGVARENLKKYVQNLVDPLYEELTMIGSNDGLNQRLLRSKILALATSMGYPRAQSRARGLFLDWLDSTAEGSSVRIEPDLRDFVYYYGAKTATLAEWERVWSLYLNETDALEVAKMQSALAAPSDVSILKRYLELAWDEKNVRSQDYFNVLSSISANPSGTALVWDHVRSKWPQIVDRFSLNNRYLGNMIPGITSSFNSELKLKEMEAFFAEYPEAGAGAAARLRALETVRNNIKWVKRHEATVASWLQEQINLQEKKI